MSLDVIKDGLNNTCSHRVLSVMPQKESIKIENKALNGSFHLQSIGQPVDIADVRCLCKFDEWENLVTAAAEARLVQVDFNGKYYDGIIRDQPVIVEYTRGARANRLHVAEFQMVVSQKG